MTTDDRRFLDELKDAISLRTVLLVAGVLLVQIAFIASYVGAFHHPSPHRIEVGVVAPTAQAGAVRDQLNAADGTPLSARVVADEASARKQIRRGDLVAVLVADPASTRDTLLVASARGTSLQTAVEQLATAAESKQGRSFTTTDVVPLQSGDARGLSGFYLVIGWLVGGYLVASLLGVAKGARPANLRRAVIRLGAMLPYAVLSGLTGALVVDQLLGALTGHFWALAAVGTLLVLSSATVTMALQVLAGTIGIGLTVLLFVVLGNPSAGGAYQFELLPALWRTVGQWLPNGAGTTALREIVYFDGHGAAGHVWLIAAWAVVGAAITLVASGMRRSAA
ncbi:ABC transporter permease [Nocardioides sp. Kera G14]|uniref:ABC transporter permease n=1 Tax=Nocardioides sp. Kera G14 TaxID=2884264 RepID=UPI001D1221EF|nr:ABC transporter permease [Nocardioides sp. Kera G14]UDY23659.1 ABC transporter permease [Nocardioides sp. Kera G14]